MNDAGCPELLPDKLEQIVKMPVVVGYVTGVWAFVNIGILYEKVLHRNHFRESSRELIVL